MRRTESLTTARPVIDAALVRRLVDTQFPHWAALPLSRLQPAGSDHEIYRLGDELSVRMPRHAEAVGQARQEAKWLPRLAPRLPLPVPVPVAVGEPDPDYPWPWAVNRWIEGRVATVEALSESTATAVDLAQFLVALQRLTTEDVSSTDFGGRPLADRDHATRAAVARVGGVFDGGAMTDLWNAALSAPGWQRPAVWFHGDLHPGNLLTVDGRLSAVIDFGELGIGDPACDLTIAFTLMTARTRAVFREALGVDDDTWMRGRGWALATGLNAYTSYAAVNPRVAAATTWQITEALAG